MAFFPFAAARQKSKRHRGWPNLPFRIPDTIPNHMLFQIWKYLTPMEEPFKQRLCGSYSAIRVPLLNQAANIR